MYIEETKKKMRERLMQTRRMQYINTFRIQDTLQIVGNSNNETEKESGNGRKPGRLRKQETEP